MKNNKVEPEPDAASNCGSSDSGSSPREDDHDSPCRKPCDRCCCCFGFAVNSRQRLLACVAAWLVPCLLLWLLIFPLIVVASVAGVIFGVPYDTCPYDECSPASWAAVEVGWRSAARSGLPFPQSVSPQSATAGFVRLGPDGRAFDANPYLIPEQYVSEVDFAAASDGVRLRGTFIAAAAATSLTTTTTTTTGCGSDNSKAVVIMTHGWSSCRGKFDVSLPAYFLWAAGYNVMTLDLRNHGDSSSWGGGTVTWGAVEHRDVLGAAAWLHATHNFSFGRIGLAAPSMGGGAALVAAAKDSRLKATWVDAPACSVAAVVEHGFERAGLGGIKGLLGNAVMHTATGFVRRATAAEGGGGLDVLAAAASPLPGAAAPTLGDLEAIDAVRHLAHDQRVYFVASTGDTSVPPAQVRECFVQASRFRPESTAAPHSYWLFDDRTLFQTGTPNGLYQNTNSHVRTALYAPDAYAQRLVRFFNASLGGKNESSGGGC